MAGADDRTSAHNGDMRLADGAVIHQVHAAKIGADIGAAIASNVLLWRERPAAAVAVRLIVPVAASGAVLALADLDGLSRTRRGRYVLAHMPPSAQLVRLAGDALMGVGASRRSAPLLLAGAAAIAVGWSHALWPRPVGLAGSAGSAGLGGSSELAEPAGLAGTRLSGGPAGPARSAGPAGGSSAGRAGYSDRW
jgi:hypothetical protein